MASVRHSIAAEMVMCVAKGISISSHLISYSFFPLLNFIDFCDVVVVVMFKKLFF